MNLFLLTVLGHIFDTSRVALSWLPRSSNESDLKRQVFEWSLQWFLTNYKISVHGNRYDDLIPCFENLDYQEHINIFGVKSELPGGQILGLKVRFVLSKFMVLTNALVRSGYYTWGSFDQFQSRTSI